MPDRILEVAFAEHVRRSEREHLLHEMRVHYGVKGSDPAGDIARLRVPAASVASLGTFLQNEDLAGRITYAWQAEDPR